VYLSICKFYLKNANPNLQKKAEGLWLLKLDGEYGFSTSFVDVSNSS
jgi:hypothetical protein